VNAKEHRAQALAWAARHEGGETVDAIAASAGLSRSYVAQRMNAAGYSPAAELKRRRLAAQAEARLDAAARRARQARALATFVELADRHGVKPSTLAQWHAGGAGRVKALPGRDTRQGRQLARRVDQLVAGAGVTNARTLERWATR
jgi:AraC-like DNA-binding protein